MARTDREPTGRTRRRRVLVLFSVAAVLLSSAVVLRGGVAAAGVAGTVCATADGGVLRYDDGAGWQVVHTTQFRASYVSGGGNGLVVQDKESATTLRYTGTPGQWVVIGGDVLDVTVGKDRFYSNGPGSGVIQEYSGRGIEWSQIGDRFGNMWAGGGGVFARSNRDSDVYRYTGTPGQWERIGGAGRDFGVTDAEFFGLSLRRDAVYRYNGHGDSWTWIGGLANRIWAGGFGLIAETPTGEILRYLNVPGQWRHIGSPGADFAVGAHTVYGISPQRDAVHRYEAATDSWTWLGPISNVTGITACP